jgi:hypothetical protein
MQEEFDSLLVYTTFEEHGHIQFLHWTKNIHVHFVISVKHDLRHRARLVTGGHLTDPNTTDSKYFSVVSL